MENIQLTDEEVFELTVRATVAELKTLKPADELQKKAQEAFVAQINEKAINQRARARSGAISWFKAANDAQRTRVHIVGVMRQQLTSAPVMQQRFA